jgi:hypothetical protein
MLRKILRVHHQNTSDVVEHDQERLAVLDDVVQLIRDIVLRRADTVLDDRERAVHALLVQGLYSYCRGAQFILAGQFTGAPPFARLTIECVLYACRFRHSAEALSAWMARHDGYVAARATSTYEDFFALDGERWKRTAREHFGVKNLLASARDVLGASPIREVVVAYLEKQYEQAIAYGAHPNLMAFVDSQVTDDEGRDALSMFSSDIDKFRYALSMHVVLGQTVITVLLALIPHEAVSEGVVDRLGKIGRALVDLDA